jgi:toxin ParE1/3/4
MFSIKITQSAKTDLIKILKYTLTEYGESQWRTYGALIEETFTLISKNPSIGHQRTDIPNYCLAWAMGSHFVIYKIENQTIYILRVLHNKMNFLLNF